MELYYSPFACSLAAHIACLEAGIAVTLRRADLPTKRVQGGGDLLQLNPMGKVPTLVCDDGSVLTENTAVLLYLADRAPATGLTPASGFARYEVIQWLSFVTTELHKRVHAPVFSAEPPEAVKQFAREGATQPLLVLESHLGQRETLVGEHFTVADIYLFWATTLLLNRRSGLSLEAYPALRAHHARHLKRPAVAAAMALEGEQYKQPFQPGV